VLCDVGMEPGVASVTSVRQVARSLVQWGTPGLACRRVLGVFAFRAPHVAGARYVLAARDRSRTDDRDLCSRILPEGGVL
jgi:hypothetical protein